MECPKCGSTHVSYDKTVGTSSLYTCRECHHKITYTQDDLIKYIRGKRDKYLKARRNVIIMSCVSILLAVLCCYGIAAVLTTAYTWHTLVDALVLLAVGFILLTNGISKLIEAWRL